LNVSLGQTIAGIIWVQDKLCLNHRRPIRCRAAFAAISRQQNADFPELEILFVGEFDEESTPFGAEGRGEPTAVPVAPAVATAAYHATGKKVRDLSMTIKKKRR
jgi:hypothetical protein